MSIQYNKGHLLFIIGREAECQSSLSFEKSLTGFSLHILDLGDVYNLDHLLPLDVIVVVNGTVMENPSSIYETKRKKWILVLMSINKQQKNILNQFQKN